MRAVAYVRVSTLKHEQALSLENQTDFFSKYISGRGDELVKIYSDKGKSATKMQNRPDLQKLISAAKRKEFDIIYVKDISRIFRNLYDFIGFTRDIIDKLGIRLHFADLGGDVDMLTLNIIAMLSENESKKISERVKFGKKFSKEQGIVPNFVFGYKRIDKYTLEPDEIEAPVVKKIFDLYTEQNWGLSRIAQHLYENRIKTKKLKDGEPNYAWSQKTIKDIVVNQIYIGRVINGKQSSKELYSYKRIENDSENWYISERPEFRLVSDEQFFRAQDLLEENKKKFPSDENGKRINIRKSETHLLSNLLKCNNCGSSFRRYQRKHTENGPQYVWWVCARRSTYGKKRCDAEHIRIEETDIINGLSLLFAYLVEDKEEFFQLIESKCNTLIREYINSSSSFNLEEIESELKDLKNQRERIKTMMKKGLLGIDEGADDMKALNKDIERLNNIINQKDVTKDLTEKIKANLKEFLRNFNDFSFSKNLTNTALKIIVKEIVVISKTELQVYFNVSDDITGLSFPIKLSDIPSKVFDEKTDTDWENRT